MSRPTRLPTCTGPEVYWKGSLNWLKSTTRMLVKSADDVIRAAFACPPPPSNRASAASIQVTRFISFPFVSEKCPWQWGDPGDPSTAFSVQGSKNQSPLPPRQWGKDQIKKSYHGKAGQEGHHQQGLASSILDRRVQVRTHLLRAT